MTQIHLQAYLYVILAFEQLFQGKLSDV